VAADDPWAGRPIEDLRALRVRARRDAEFVRLRARQEEGAAERLAELDARVRSLTDALISRYAEDLSLVDSLLDPAYPAYDTEDGRARR
jgi:hypothetical protein